MPMKVLISCLCEYFLSHSRMVRAATKSLFLKKCATSGSLFSSCYKSIREGLDYLFLSQLLWKGFLLALDGRSRSEHFVFEFKFVYN